MNEMNKIEMLSTSTYVINVVKPERTLWHRHFTRRCRKCRTFIVYFCDTTEKKCDIKSHSNNTMYSYALSNNSVPSYVKKEIVWNECREHII